jgi:hypothetical protein
MSGSPFWDFMCMTGSRWCSRHPRRGSAADRRAVAGGQSRPGGIGLILIGMPGFERQLARYPKLYSRIGFAPQVPATGPRRVPPVPALYWTELGLTVNPAHTPPTVKQPWPSPASRRNSRLIERLLGQVARLLSISQLDAITVEVVEAARETLVIGT